MTTTALQNEAIRLLRSRYSFIALQVLDLGTTLLAFHKGAFEVNPLVARMGHWMGPLEGVLFSKAITCLLVFRVRRLVWIANLFYAGVICWNCIILLALSARHH